MKIIDMGLLIHENIRRWPDPKYKAPELTWLINGDEEGPRKNRFSGQIKLYNHIGTHMDSPKHYGYNSTIDQTDLNVTCGPCYVVKFHDLPKHTPITADMLAEKVPADYDCKGKRLIIGCGYLDENWETNDNYFPEAPYLHDSGAKWAVEKGFVLVGLDMQTDGESAIRGPVSHIELLSHGVYILEYLCNFDQWPEGESFLIATPLKLKGMEASVVRPALIDFNA